MCSEFKCDVCKKDKIFKSFKDLATHCVRRGDREHIEFCYNDSNLDDWVTCKVENCFFRASRIDLHIKKKHDLTRQLYEEIYCSPVMSKNFMMRVSESGRHANDGKDFSGENNPFFGRKHTEESKQSISRSTITNNALLEKHFNKDRKASEETKRLMSESRMGDKNPMYGKRRKSVLHSIKGD
jgi:hypothetical protein